MYKKLLLVATCIALLSVCLKVSAQTVEAFGDDAADPVRLFERGQSAHARGEIEKALAYYEQALKVRPEFPEAEFQRGNALASLGRLDEADGLDWKTAVRCDFIYALQKDLLREQRGHVSAVRQVELLRKVRFCFRWHAV